MTIMDTLGLGTDKKIRYAIVGAGSISQEAMMPGVKHTGNSIITALVTSDPKKATELASKYDIPKTYNYDQFEALIKSGEVDAIYLATPNWRHAEFAVPALEAGISRLAGETDGSELREVRAIDRSAGRLGRSVDGRVPPAF